MKKGISVLLCICVCAISTVSCMEDSEKKENKKSRSKRKNSEITTNFDETDIIERNYVKKSKISAANSAAGSIDKAVDSVLTDLKCRGVDVSGELELYWNGTAWSGDIATLEGDDTGFTKGIAEYFYIKQVKAAYAYIYNGTCVAVACTVDNKYWGSVPSGIVTPENSDLMQGGDSLY